jgi:pseudouridine 5'-phosphatase
MSNLRSVSQVLFDMDGLLLDTETIYTKVTQAIVGRFGKVFDWSIKANMIGRSSRESSKYLVKALDLPITGDDYLAERDSLLRKAFPASDAMPGAERLVRHLHAHNIPIAVATSSGRELYELKITRHNWFDLFNTIVTSDDPAVGAAKPAPDIFLVAASRLGGTPGDSLVFEDAPSGLQAGRTAGMQVVAIPDPNMHHDKYGGAAQILQNLDAFKPELFGLPAY